jgi:hypothetical protein
MTTQPIDGNAVGSGRVERTVRWVSRQTRPATSAWTPAHPASPDYGPTGNRFTGKIAWVQIDIGEDGHDHLIQPQDRLNIAMARQ